MKIGFTIGKFAPFHKGHETLINQAISEMDEVYILINNTDVSNISLQERASWIKSKYPKANIILGKNPPRIYGMDEKSIKIQTDYLKEIFKDIPVTHFYSSEEYGKYVARDLNVIDRRVRKTIPISATKIRNNIEGNKQYLEESVYNEITRRTIMKENILDILEQRGYIEQVTFEEDLKKLLENESVPFYIGFDPTADSLHVGHFVSMMVASYMQKAGHKPIILVGGGTASIGDPSGKTDMRKMMTRETINHNVEGCKKQLERFISFEGENAAVIVNNADWLLNLNFIDFMRDIGSLFTINKMLSAECYKARKDTGLTFFEMGYMLMQSYDFLYLHDNYNCKLQMGGNDQWSNILGGVDLIRKIGHSDSYGLTFRLLTTKEGKKMGKTEKGALWLDKEKTSPYEFYQYWRNIADADVKVVLSMLTFLPMDEINRLANLEGEKINEAKKIAAFEITKLVHGEEEAKKAEEAANSLFGGSGTSDNMPETKVSENDSILDIIIKAGFAPSKGQAKILVNQGGITLDDEKITDVTYKITKEQIEKHPILRKGKKSFCKLV